MSLMEAKVFGVLARSLLLLLALWLFVFLGVGILNAITDGRASPEETLPWLTLVGLAIGLFWIRRKKRSLAKKPLAPPEPPKAGDSVSTTKPEAPCEDALESISPLFISYRRSDSSDVTGRVYDRLVQHFSRESIFKDVDSIPLGVDYRKHLTDSVSQCQLLLAVVGRGWLSDENEAQERRLDDPGDCVRIEIETAFDRNIPVIPLLVQGATMPQEEELPSSLRALAYQNAISVRPDPDFHQDMTRLINGIETHLDKIERK